MNRELFKQLIASKNQTIYKKMPTFCQIIIKKYLKKMKCIFNESN